MGGYEYTKIHKVSKGYRDGYEVKRSPQRYTEIRVDYVSEPEV